MLKPIRILSILLAVLLTVCLIAATVPFGAQNSRIMGDTDGDGYVTIMDATVIQRYLVELPVPDPEQVLLCGDVSGDTLDILDATIIQRYLVGLSYIGRVNVPVEQPTEEPTQSISGPAFVIGSASARPGDKDTAITVAVKNNPGIASILLELSFDRTALTLTGFTYNTSALSGASVTAYSTGASIPSLSMVNGTQDVTGDWVFATLYFDVADTASGVYPVTVSYDPDNVYDITETNIAFEIVGGSVTVSP